MTGSVLAAAAWLALAAPPLAEAERTLTLALCNGGEITIPLGDGNPPARDCDPKACHGAACREKAKEKGGRAGI